MSFDQILLVAIIPILTAFFAAIAPRLFDGLPQRALYYGSAGFAIGMILSLVLSAALLEGRDQADIRQAVNATLTQIAVPAPTRTLSPAEIATLDELTIEAEIRNLAATASAQP